MQSLYLFPVNELEVLDIISNLKNTDSKGPDNIPTSLIKSCGHELCQILTYINNCSLLDGVFPEKLKIAKIIPIFKSGDVSIISNYRPISILSAFSKISEKLVSTRLINYLTQHSILHKNQFGFRPKLSTCLALLQLIDDASKSIDDGNITVGVFINLAKAFDTVDHAILLNKLNFYGIRGTAFNCVVRSYLTNRNQYVSLNKVESSCAPICCGVPQGSILGPILFLIYINDLNSYSKTLKTIMFADDTNLFLSGKNIKDIETRINDELELMTEWFRANLLSLNVSKTSFIVFGNRKNLEVKIYIDNMLLERQNDTKFLGVILSSDLKWNKHVDTVVNKITKTIGIISKVRHFLPISITRTLYLTLVEPYINYCNLVWALPHSTVSLDKIYKIQKRYCRIINFAHYRAHSEPLFQKLSILNIYQIYQTQLAIYMYQQTHNLLPHDHLKHFLTNSSIHTYNTRQKSNLHIEYTITTSRQNTARMLGPRLWNILPTEVKSAPVLPVFKRRLKKLLLSNLVVVVVVVVV